MSTKTGQPEIVETEEFETNAKWLKLQRIKWRDQEGKEVGRPSPSFGVVRRVS